MKPKWLFLRLRIPGPALNWLRSRVARCRRIRTELGYGAFLSYSGDRDRQWLPHLQRAIEKQSRPWYRPPRIRVFLDDSGVSIGPRLWGKIEAGLARSEWLVVMASPDSKESTWVDREIEWWLKHKSVDTILLVVSDGQLVWDEQRGDWNAELSTALPARLAGKFEQQPVWKTVDLHSPDNGTDPLPDIDSVALGIASVVRGLPEDDLKSEGMRDTRRNLRTARFVAAILGLLLLITSTVSVIALVQRAEATRQRDHAVAQQLISQSSFLATRDPFAARLKALAAWRIDPTPESRLAVLNAAVNPQTGLLGHSWPVGSVAFSPDGKTIASGSGDGIVRLWDAATQRKIGDSFVGHNRGVTSVVFASDGKTLASSSFDGTVRIWNIADRDQIGDAFRPRSGMVYSVAFSPDGRTLVTGGENGSGAAVRIYDLETHRQIGKLLGGRTNSVTTVAFSPDGKSFATGSDNGLQLWDANSHAPLGKALGPANISVSSVSFSRDGKTIASAGSDGSVRIWTTSVGRLVGKPSTVEAGRVDSVELSPDGAMFAASYADGSVHLWDVSRRVRVGGPFTGHTSTVSAVDFSPEGSTLASASEDTTVRLWDVRAQRQIGPSINTGSADSIVLSPDGRTLAAAGSETGLRFWDMAERRPVGDPLEKGELGLGPAIAFSPDSTMLAMVSGSTRPRVKLWDVRTRRQIGKSMRGHSGDILDLAFSPNGKTLVSSGTDSLHTWNPVTSLRTWDPATQRQVGRPLKDMGVPEFSLDGRLFATMREGNTVVFWDAATRRRIGGSRSGHTAEIRSIAFSPDSSLLATASRDNTVRLWSVATRKENGEPLTGHRSGVLSVAFSRDGKTMVTGSMDGTVRLWDVASRRQIGEPLEGHGAAVTGAVFRPDGKTIASWSEDNTVRLWDVDATVDPVHSLCKWANGAFTADQWRAHVPEGPAYRRLCPKAEPG
ncbi:toll/interleukin-1 receptor domain-containing protein [Streptomyces cavernicola]|uniref:TIR domain-containing protein n=1 Tax=Streptomyces cavernicola TaxID=3043613 RepID=A0ABT6S7M1_9ACTN|nr:TIR domain-containing protein [Streptomyces sp. B-S-A6]MDI3404097.1 TIR domain-containing protein [Streptomyces sp. B-S-A6]